SFQCNHLYVCLLPRRARSTLFPYTTLFRSRYCQQFTTYVTCDTHTRGGLRHWVDFRGAEFRSRKPEVVGAATNHRCNGCSPAQLDRKSTRLNSSHVKISYAVFCLKKTITIE